MPGKLDKKVQAELEAFKARYLENLHKRFTAIEEAWAELRADPADRARLETLARLAHSLAGSSGLLELHALRDAARELEGALDGLAAAGQPVDVASARRIEGLVAALRACAPAS